MWKIDFFIHGENEGSDLNHGLSLKMTRENYKQFGAAQKIAKKYCRE